MIKKRKRSIPLS